MLYPQYIIDDLKDRADLVRIVQPYAPDLKKKGANWMACCPFHQEKTPSFSVNPAKGLYKCFGCGKGGTAFNFVMEMEGVNFPEAVKRVAEITGFALPEPQNDDQFRQNQQRREEKKQLAEQVIELNQIALEFWEKEMSNDNSKARAAREYLAARGISEEIQKEFRIGYSPDEWDSLLGLLRDFGADETLIARCGLVSINEEKDRTYDRFRGRIMFPVLDVDGRPVAFGARALGDAEPKYLNSPETPAYTKGDHLYGLFQSKDAIRKKKFAILVEGYLDLIALYQHGITNVAASLGTAFTDNQAKLLHRFTERVVVNYDGDTAGIKAARRAVEHLLPRDLDVKVLVLPDGLDPDDYVRANGAEAYNAARGNAMPFLAFSLDAVSQGRDLANARQKADAIEDLTPVIAAIKNNIQRRESFDQAMDFFRIDDAGLKREIWTAVNKDRPAHHGETPRNSKPVIPVKATLAEKRLLQLLLFDEDLKNAIIPNLEPGDHQNLATSEIFAKMIDAHADGEPISADTFASKLDPMSGGTDLLAEILPACEVRDPEIPIESVLSEAEGCLISLRLMAIDAHVAELSRQALIAERSGDLENASNYSSRQLELEKIRFELKRKTVEM